MLGVFLILFSGCSSNDGGTTTVTTEHPDAKEVLTLDPNADIFQLDGLVYQTNIDWVEELSLTKKEQIGEIKTTNDKDTNFKDEMANKLPVGAKIYTTNENGILIVEFGNESKKYLAVVEG